MHPEEVLAAALHSAALERDIAALDDGLETIVGARGVKLSGGQIQRAAAARMFVRNAELLVFDDLSSALDVETEQLLWDRLDDRRPANGVADSSVVLHPDSPAWSSHMGGPPSGVPSRSSSSRMGASRPRVHWTNCSVNPRRCSGSGTAMLARRFEH